MDPRKPPNPEFKSDYELVFGWFVSFRRYWGGLGSNQLEIDQKPITVSWCAIPTDGFHKTVYEWLIAIQLKSNYET